MLAPALKVMVLGLRGFPNVQGGVEKHAEMMYPKIVEYGCNVSVIGRANYRAHAVERHWKGVKFHWLWAPQIRGLESMLHSLLGVAYAALSRADLLHIHAIGPALVTPLARAVGLRVVVTHHGPDYDRQKWGLIAKGILRLGERLGMNFANERIAISAHIKELIARKYGLNSTLIPNGVEISTDAPRTDVLDRFGLRSGQYILQVSRLVPEKRQTDLIAAFKRAHLAGWKLVLVGDTEFPDEYSQSVLDAAATESSIVVTGFLTGQPLHDMYAQAGLFVLPSSHEGLPIALLEALSFGIRSIVSDIPANREVDLPAQSYFPVGDVESLASSIAREASRPPIDDAERSALRAHVIGRYDWDVIARETLEVYLRALKPRVPPSTPPQRF